MCTCAHAQKLPAHTPRYSGGAQHITASPLHSASSGLNTSASTAVKASTYRNHRRLVSNIVNLFKNTWRIMCNDQLKEVTEPGRKNSRKVVAKSTRSFFQLWDIQHLSWIPELHISIATWTGMSCRPLEPNSYQITSCSPYSQMLPSPSFTLLVTGISTASHSLIHLPSNQSP